MIDATHIVAVWDDATADDRATGLQWYGRAAELAASMATAAPRLTVSACAGAIAALSPMVGWRQNLGAARELAELYAECGECGICPAFGYGLQRNVVKAWRCLSGEPPLEVLGGRKVRAFYANIMGDPDAITVDRWAVRIAHGQPDHPGSITSREHTAIEAAYRAAAERVGASPRDLQAATWVAYRRIHGRPHNDPQET